MSSGRSKELELFIQGCLSFNQVWVAVRRPFSVRVVGYDVDGNEREFDCEDCGASLMQPEIDHLDGILTLHRAGRAERHRAISELIAAETNAARTVA